MKKTHNEIITITMISILVEKNIGYILVKRMKCSKRIKQNISNNIQIQKL